MAGAARRNAAAPRRPQCAAVEPAPPPGTYLALPSRTYERARHPGQIAGLVARLRLQSDPKSSTWASLRAVAAFSASSARFSNSSISFRISLFFVFVI